MLTVCSALSDTAIDFAPKASIFQLIEKINEILGKRYLENILLADEVSHGKNCVVQEEFDNKASNYEHNRLAKWYQAQGKCVLRQIENVAGQVVDVGCGTGWLLRRLLHRYPDATGIGIDLSGRMIEEAKKKAHDEGLDRCSFIQGDWENLKTRKQIIEQLDGPVSLIICVSTFHYFRHAELSARSMYDLLDYGGRLLLLDRAMDGSCGTFIWDVLHRYLIKDQVQFYTTSQLVMLLEKSGFQCVQVPERINRFFWKGKLYTSLNLFSGLKLE